MVHPSKADWLPRLDLASSVPLYEQLVEQVALAVAAGHLSPGDPLPSVRVLASTLRINPNTAARAVRELELRGLALAQRGVGTVVAEGAPKVAQERARELLRRDVLALVTVARRLGFEEKELMTVVGAVWKEHEP
ncbi:MAG: GntR family transcriptional regulator [Acidobacteriota bacterium]